MALKRLVVKEFVTSEDMVVKYRNGHKYSYFQDPETGKYYEPLDGYTVTGKDLAGLFREVTDDTIKEV
jgi:hypothetical protein